MAVPSHLLVHAVTIVEPAETANSYGDISYDYGAAATRTPARAWLQQDQRTEQFADGRDPLDERWLLIANEAEISGIARIEWDDHPAGPIVFEVDGPTAPTYSPAGLHHLEARLRIVTG